MLTPCAQNGVLMYVLCSFEFSKSFTISIYDFLDAEKSVKVKIHFDSCQHVQGEEQTS